MYGYQPGRPPAPVARAPREAWQRPVRIVPVPGTPYGLAIYGEPPVTSGPAVGSLVAGVGALAVAFVVSCFGLVGAADGWGAWVAGAFAVLAGFLGSVGIGLGLVGLRRTRRAAVAGRGLAVTGLICGAVGVVLTLAALGAVLAIQLT